MAQIANESEAIVNKIQIKGENTMIDLLKFRMSV